ncbi:MAG: hypothetical protein HYZ53_29435 [Planctomycetes bacterium]|nr:hypothetical protein [Planctomycetota bacterium]
MHLAEIDATGPFAHLALIAVAAASLLVAAGTGERLLRWANLLRDAPDEERFLFGLGLGLGLVSLTTLGLGLAGALHRGLFLLFASVLAVPGGANAVRWAVVAGRRARAFLREAPADERVVAVLCLVFALPALLLSGFPPLDYDDLEYHLGAPTRYLEEGRISFWPTVVYAAFPLNSEMWTLAGMVVAGSAWKGALFGKAVNAWLCLALAGGTAALGRRFLSRSAGLYAAAFLLCCVETGIYPLRNYVEPYLALQSLLALHAFLGFVLGAPPASAAPGPPAPLSGLRALVVAALATGFAIGCKYPAVLFLLCPLGLGLLFHAYAAPLSRTLRSGLLHALLYAALALLPALPWLARNAVDTGNPVYPLLGGPLGGRDWSAEQEARFREAHRPRGTLLDCASGLAAAAYEPPFRLSLLLVAFLPFLACTRPWPPALRWLGAYTALGVALWWLFTHRIDRFLYPLFPAFALLSAAGLTAAAVRLRVLRAGALLLLCFYVVVYGVQLASPYLPVALGLSSVSETLSKQLPGFAALRDLPASVPTTGRVLLVGEDRTFYCPRTSLAATVFDRNPLVVALDEGRGPEALRAVLRGAGVTHVYVGWSEVERLNATYTFRWGDAGARKPGFWSLRSRDEFLARTAGVLERVRDWQVWEPVPADGGGEASLEGWWGELYRVK